MDNKEYGDLVNSDKYPADIRVPLDKPFVDDRGIIQNIWLAASGSITFITSKAGAIRAKHRHGLDWHGTYIIEGSVKYIEGEEENQKEFLFGPGDLFFTRPGVYHEMHFLENSTMITINNICKNHENYENDVVRYLEKRDELRKIESQIPHPDKRTEENLKNQHSKITNELGKFKPND